MKESEAESFSERTPAEVREQMDPAKRAKIADHRVLELEDELGKTQERARTAERESSKDPLTGILNRRGFMNRAIPEISLANRQYKLARKKGSSIESIPPLTFVVVDLDDFKAINDRHGHSVGDRALKAVGRFLQDEVARRGEDVIARAGEGADEFWMLASGDIGQVQKHLKMKGSGYGKVSVSTDIVVDGQPLKISLSVGLAQYHPEGEKETAQESIERTLEEADALAYKAKGNGNSANGGSENNS